LFFPKNYSRQHKKKYANTKYGKKGGARAPLIQKKTMPEMQLGAGSEKS
jgi:hypothetical protein